LSTLIKGSTLILPSACLVPFPECEPISVEAFPISSWVQLIPCFLPSREVDFVKPRIACLEIVYENESACQLGIYGIRRDRTWTGSIGRDGTVVDDPTS
jgi:hypothetical protein